MIHAPDHRDSRHARELLTLQQEDGLWPGGFHGLAQPGKAPPTTEQALRRLAILGFTAADDPIRRCVATLAACLRGERKVDAYWETGLDWAMFEPLMLAAWIRRFDPDHPDALAFARRWARVIEAGFTSGSLDASSWNAAYEAEFRRAARHPRPLGFSALYHAMLLPGLLTAQAEDAMVRHILATGVYYVYDAPLTSPPEFASRATPRYLAALSLLMPYPAARAHLAFAADWLRCCARPDGAWDLGSNAADRVYLPLSDSWRSRTTRLADCTEMVRSFLLYFADAPYPPSAL